MKFQLAIALFVPAYFLSSPVCRADDTASVLNKISAHLDGTEVNHNFVKDLLAPGSEQWSEELILAIHNDLGKIKSAIKARESTLGDDEVRRAHDVQNKFGRLINLAFRPDLVEQMCDEVDQQLHKLTPGGKEWRNFKLTLGFYGSAALIYLLSPYEFLSAVASGAALSGVAAVPAFYYAAWAAETRDRWNTHWLSIASDLGRAGNDAHRPLTKYYFSILVDKVVDKLDSLADSKLKNVARSLLTDSYFPDLADQVANKLDSLADSKLKKEIIDSFAFLYSYLLYLYLSSKIYLV